MKNIIQLLLIAVLLINCSENEIISNINSFNDSEISFNQDKTNMSLTSQTIGIIGFANGEIKTSSEFTFTLDAEITLLNGRDFNFNNTFVSVKKEGFKSYEVSAELDGIGSARLFSDFTNNLLTLEINGHIFGRDELSKLKGENHIALIVMSSILDDVLFDNIIEDVQKNESNGRAMCLYYGYIVGWGWTSEQSEDHESCVRGGACESITKYNCIYLGTSTSCSFERIGCVTISTYRCDDGTRCER